MSYGIHIFSCFLKIDLQYSKECEHCMEVLVTPDVCQHLVFSVLMTNEVEHLFILVSPEI